MGTQEQPLDYKKQTAKQGLCVNIPLLVVSEADFIKVLLQCCPVTVIEFVQDTAAESDIRAYRGISAPKWQEKRYVRMAKHRTLW